MNFFEYDAELSISTQAAAGSIKRTTVRFRRRPPQGAERNRRNS